MRVDRRDDVTIFSEAFLAQWDTSSSARRASVVAPSAGFLIDRPMALRISGDPLTALVNISTVDGKTPWRFNVTLATAKGAEFGILLDWGTLSDYQSFCYIIRGTGRDVKIRGLDGTKPRGGEWIRLVESKLAAARGAAAVEPSTPSV